MGPVDPGFELTDAERNSALWQKLSKYFTSTLWDMRERNDETNSEVATAFLRGRIDFNKEFLALGETPPPNDPVEPEPY